MTRFWRHGLVTRRGHLRPCERAPRRCLPERRRPCPDRYRVGDRDSIQRHGPVQRRVTDHAEAGLRARAEEFRGPEWIHEIVEAAVRSENMERAEELAREVSAMTQACGTKWALAVQAYCQALVVDRPRGGAPPQVGYPAASSAGRTASHIGPRSTRPCVRRVAQGARPRRRAPRPAARRCVLAHEAFEQIGCTSVCGPRRPLRLRQPVQSGRKRSQQTEEALTAQEAQVARLARDGHSNQKDRRTAVHQPADGRVPPARRSSPSSTSQPAISFTEPLR